MTTDFGEFGQLLDFDAPTLVVGQVPVHAVNAVQSDHVDESFHTISSGKVTSHIEHRATIGKARSIVDFHTGQSDSTIFWHICTLLFTEVGEWFAKCLDAIERTRLGASCNAHRFAVDA